MRLIRHGQTGPDVHDVQQRLDALGLSYAPDPGGEYGQGTVDAVRTFQQRRGLPADGIVGPDTWRSLVEASFSLGDRMLYLAQPMLRGDDVRQLQERLNRLGFDSGHVDGILGSETVAAVTDFQANTGLVTDGVAGPATFAALTRLHRSHQAVPASDVRERHRLGQHERRRSLAGVPLLVDASGGPDEARWVSPDGVPEHVITWQVASRLHGRLAALGARPVLARGPGTTPPTNERAALANREDVAAIVSIHCNGLSGSNAARGVAAAYFGTPVSTSDHGRTLANLAVQRISDATGTPNCRAHPSTAGLLREARAVAAIVELGFLTHPDEGRLLADPDHQGRLAACLTDALITFLLT